MSPADPTSGGAGELRPIGSGESIAIPDVSMALARLWAAAGGSGPERIVRACQGVLIFWRPPAGDASFENLVDEMTRQRPVRVVVLEEAPAGERVRATISALCHLRGVRERVCCEKIRLPLPEGSEELSASAARALLRSDVPILIWSPREPPLDQKAFIGLCRDADLLLIDSETFASRVKGFRGLLGLAGDPRGPRPVDWAWQRLEIWREAISDAFEPAARRERIPDLRQIVLTLPAAQRSRVPAAAFLLAGWILSTAGNRRVEVEIARTERPPGRLEFRFAAGPPVEVVPGTTGDPRGGGPEMLAEILGRKSGDPAYERALPEALALAGNTGGEWGREEGDGPSNPDQ